MTIYYKITSKCNQNCNTCYEKYNITHNNKNLENITNERIIFFGGEPTLEYEKLIKTIKLSKSKKNKIVLISNGLFLDNINQTKELNELCDEIILKRINTKKLKFIELINKDKTKILIQQFKEDKNNEIIQFYTKLNFKNFIFEYFFAEKETEKEYITYKEFFKRLNQFTNINIQTSNIPKCIKELFKDKTKSYSGSSYDIIENYPTKYCNLCNERNSCEGFSNYLNEELIPQIKHILIKPTEAKIELTYNCNMNCDFCMNKNTINNEKEMSTDEIKKTIQILKKNGIKTIRFTGGEPTIKKDIWELIKFTKELNLTTLLNTNARAIKNEEIELINKYVDQFMVSLHNLNDPDVNRIKVLVSKITKPKKIINVISNKQTISKFKEYTNLAIELNSDITFLRPIENPNTKNNIENKYLEELIDKIYEFNKNNKNKIHMTAMPFCFYNPDKLYTISNAFWTCGIGKALVINPEGFIKYCYSINEPFLKLTETNFNEILKEFEKYKTGEFLPPECINCKLLFDCLGGCRFSAKKATGNKNGLDPFANPKNIK